MKKTLFLLAAAAISTACSMDETTEVNNGLPIDFRTAVATRGTQIETGDLESFNVWAYYDDNTDYFTKVQFTKQEDNFFKSSTDYYWPTDNSELTFYAYAPIDLDPTEESFTGETNTITYTSSNTISEQKDFITAMNTGSKADQVLGVDLSFKHRLSQIEVKAYYTGSKYNIKVSGVQIANVYQTGTYTFDTDADGDGSWATSGNKVSYTAECTETELTSTEDAVSVMGADGNWMLIPQTGLQKWNSESDATNTSNGTYLAVNIQIKETGGGEIYPKTETGSGDEFEWAAVPIDIAWEQNTKYVYTLKFTDESAGVIPPGDGGGEEILGYPIMFSVNTDVEEWGSTESTTLP